MIQAFFNVALNQSGRLPSPDERDTFVNKRFFLSAVSFEESIKGVESASINEPALVGELLKTQGGAVDADLLAQVHRRYEEEVLGSGDVRNWHKLVQRIFDESKDDVGGSLEKDSGVYGPAGMVVRSNRQRKLREIQSTGDTGVRLTLFQFLDNPARGGLDFTIAWSRKARSAWKARPANWPMCSGPTRTVPRKPGRGSTGRWRTSRRRAAAVS